MWDASSFFRRVNKYEIRANKIKNGVLNEGGKVCSIELSTMADFLAFLLRQVRFSFRQITTLSDFTTGV